jgi:hypothetical protein
MVVPVGSPYIILRCSVRNGADEEKARGQLLRCGIVKPQFGQDGAPIGGNDFWHLGQAVERRMPQWAQNCQFGETSCWHA